MPPHRTTMRDVASLAGVSPKTVSNVITGSVPVRQQTRERVESAMHELDFVPNLSARGLRNGRTGVIGFALPQLSTEFSASITHFMVEAARKRGFVVQIEETGGDPDRERNLVTRAQTHLIDGLVLNCVRLEDSVIEQVQHLPPVVLIGEVEQHRTDRVFIDSRSAGREVTEHVLAQGARRIVALGGSERRPAGKTSATLIQRLGGFHDALAEAGIPPDPELHIDVPVWSIEGGAAGARELLDRGVPFDAVVAFTDSMAIGALHVFRQAGIEVPQDVLLTGVDDIEAASFAASPLTTVRFDHQRYAAEALDLLSFRMADRSAPTQATQVPHQVVVRASTSARPRGHRPTA